MSASSNADEREAEMHQLTFHRINNALFNWPIMCPVAHTLEIMKNKHICHCPWLHPKRSSCLMLKLHGACSVGVKLLDLHPQGRWFDPRCGHDKICTAVGPLSKAPNPTLLQWVCLLLSLINCKSLWLMYTGQGVKTIDVQNKINKTIWPRTVFRSLASGVGYYQALGTLGWAEWPVPIIMPCHVKVTYM